MTSPNRIAIAALLLVSATASAQPTPPPPPAPPPPPTPAPVAEPAPMPVDPAAMAPEAPPAEAPAAEAPAAEKDDSVSWKYDKGLAAVSADEQFEMKLGLRSQVRLDITRPEAKDEFENRLSLPRVRLQLEGFAFGKANAYKVEYDLANKGFSVLKDFYLERTFVPAVRLRVGQWKKPFSRQELTSDFAQAFIERSPVGEFAGAGRDIGAAIHNGYEKSPDGIEWVLGVFNGTGDKSAQKLTCEAPDDPADPIDPNGCKVSLPSNVPTDFLPELVARVGFNGGGIKGYSELDLEGGGPRYAIGAAYKLRMNETDSDLLEHAAELDAMFKAFGFDFTGGAFLVKKGQEDAGFGGYGQAGYLAVPERLAVAARVGTTPVDGTTAHRVEMLGAINLLCHGHGLKLVLDGGAIHDIKAETDDLVIRAQAQAVF